MAVNNINNDLLQQTVFLFDSTTATGTDVFSFVIDTAQFELGLTISIFNKLTTGTIDLLFRQSDIFTATTTTLNGADLEDMPQVTFVDAELTTTAGVPFSTFTTTGDGDGTTPKNVGIIGNKRLIQVTVDPTGAIGTLAILVLGKGELMPIDGQTMVIDPADIPTS